MGGGGGCVAAASLPFNFLFHNTSVFLVQVANAANLNASAVLIYPDPEDYSLEDTTELFGHVSLITAPVHG